MAEAYFGGAPNAFQGGIEFSATQRRRRLNENALAALIQRYGPEAADPQSLAMLQRIEQSEQLHPLDLAEAQRVDAAHAAEVERSGPLAGDPAAQQRDMAMRLQAARRGANVLKLTKQRKGDLGRAFDLVSNLLPALGIPADQMATLREHVVTDPDTVDELIAFLQDPNLDSSKSLSSGVAMRNNQTGQLEWVIPTETGFRTVPGYTPASAEQADTRLRQGEDRLRLGYQNLEFDKIEALLPARAEGVQTFLDEEGNAFARIVPGSKAEQEFDKNLREADATDRKYMQAYSTIADHNTVVTTNARRALEYFNSADGGLILQNIRRGAPLIAGTAMYDAWDALEAIKNNIGIDELQRMRQSSPTGGAMGNVSDRDIAILTGALGRLETARDPARMVEDINTILNSYRRIMSFAKQDAENAQYRTRLRTERRATQPRTGASVRSEAGTFRPNNPFAGGNN